MWLNLAIAGESTNQWIVLTPFNIGVITSTEVTPILKGVNDCVKLLIRSCIVKFWAREFTGPNCNWVPHPIGIWVGENSPHAKAPRFTYLPGLNDTRIVDDLWLDMSSCLLGCPFAKFFLDVILSVYVKVCAEDI